MSDKTRAKTPRFKGKPQGDPPVPALPCRRRSLAAALAIASFAIAASIAIARQQSPGPPDIGRTIEQCSRSNGLDPALVRAVIQVESRGRSDAVSKAGAVGLMQVMPGTAAHVAGEMGLPPVGRGDLLDPEINVRIGTWYLARMQETFRDDHLAIAAYNAGPGNVRKWVKSNPGLGGREVVERSGFAQTRMYVTKVMKAWKNPPAE